MLTFSYLFSAAALMRLCAHCLQSALEGPGSGGMTHSQFSANFKSASISIQPMVTAVMQVRALMPSPPQRQLTQMAADTESMRVLGRWCYIIINTDRRTMQVLLVAVCKNTNWRLENKGKWAAEVKRSITNRGEGATVVGLGSQSGRLNIIFSLHDGGYILKNRKQSWGKVPHCQLLCEWPLASPDSLCVDQLHP